MPLLLPSSYFEIITNSEENTKMLQRILCISHQLLTGASWIAIACFQNQKMGIGTPEADHTELPLISSVFPSTHSRAFVSTVILPCPWFSQPTLDLTNLGSQMFRRKTRVFSSSFSTQYNNLCLSHVDTAPCYWRDLSILGFWCQQGVMEPNPSGVHWGVMLVPHFIVFM